MLKEKGAADYSTILELNDMLQKDIGALAKISSTSNPRRRPCTYFLQSHARQETTTPCRSSGFDAGHVAQSGSSITS